MEQTYSQVLPKSRTGQAIAYAYALWLRMKRYLQDGRIKIDNNLAENAIRPLTISRKNFLFCGNHEAAENTAIICSLLATCKTQEVNPREWLNDVMPNYQRIWKKVLEKSSRNCFPMFGIQRNLTKIQCKYNITPMGVQKNSRYD